MKPPHVVILGGGYAGIKALEVLKKRGDIRVTLVDRHPYHYLQTDVYDFIASKSSLTDITVSLITLSASFGAHIKFLHDKVVDFAPESQSVRLESAGVLRYDYLLIALGSRTFFPNTLKGLHDFSHGIKSLKWALLFKQKFEQAIHEKIETEGRCELNPHFNIVIGGGGISGVEIAAAISEYSEHIFKESGRLCERVQVYLVAGSGLLKGMSDYLVETSRQKLMSLKIEIIEQARVQEVRASSILLSNGKEIPMNFMIWTGGIKSAPVLEQLQTPKNHRNHLYVNKTLQLPDYPTIFAAGDCAIIENKDGKQLPPTAQLAELSGTLAARNIIDIIDKKTPSATTDNLRFDGVLVALGGRDGAAHILQHIRFRGLLAYWTKRWICGSYKARLIKRCRSVLSSPKQILTPK
jgi:NADH dehydrogenase